MQTKFTNNLDPIFKVYDDELRHWYLIGVYQQLRIYQY